jgi:hypothetical protein
MNLAAISSVISFLIVAFLSGEKCHNRCFTGLDPSLMSILCSINSFGTPGMSIGDEDITPSHTHNDPLLDIQGPITRTRARQLNLEVSSFLSNSLYDFENRLLPNDYMVLRNEGEVQETHGGGLGGVEDQRGRPDKDGGPNQVKFESASHFRTSLPLTGHPGRVRTPFSMIHICMESLFDKEANLSGPTSKAIRNQ